MNIPKKIDKILNDGITRKQYLLLVILGFLLAPIKILVAFYIGIYFTEVVGYRAYGIIIGSMGFFLIGIYFYIIRMKRLKDLGLGDNELLVSKYIPGGSTILEALLLGKNSHKTARHHVLPDTRHSFFHSKSEIFLVASLFILLLGIYIVLFMTLIEGIQ